MQSGESKDKVVICFIDVLERLYFFNRVDKAFSKHGIKIIFLTNRLSCYLIGLSLNCKIYLVTKNLNKINNSLSNTLEVKSQILSQRDSETLYSSIFNKMEDIIKRNNIIGLFNWNGSLINSLASKEIAKKYDLSILFFEIGNFSGKIFADPIGTNSDSSISANPDLLLKNPINKSDYNIWRDQFIKNRKDLKTIPQAFKISKVNFYFLLDLLGFLFLPKSSNAKTLTKIVNRFKLKIIHKKLYKLSNSELPEEFVFFPLQVSNDTNIILRSKIDNLMAIDKIHDFAKGKGLPLVIRTHPAESSPKFLYDLYKIIKDKNITISDQNAFLLLEKSKYAFTINSTLGLEAKILGKDITTLGKCLYDDWNEEHITSYIQNFLLNIDYFSNSEIADQPIKKLLDKLFS